METVAENGSVSPSNTDPDWGVMVMVMEGGGGGGGATEPAPPPPQPRVHAPAARRTAVHKTSRPVGEVFFAMCFVCRICERGRMPCRYAGGGPDFESGSRRRTVPEIVSKF